MNKEFDFLKIIKNTLSDSNYIGDDCAYLDEYKIALSSDSLIEDVHFSCRFMTPEEIARKALLVNISDIIASGAEPKYALVALSGKLDNEFVEKFYQGLNETAEKYKIKIIGGDLTKGEKISITITALGDYKKRKISSRKNAKADYVLAVAGEFGSSAQGLYDLQNEIKDDYFIKKHKEPILFYETASEIAQNSIYPYAMMDSSDGLFDCAFQISEKSKVQISIDYDKIPKKTANKDFVLYGGEDYSLVVAIHQDDFKKIKGLTKIGECKKGTDVLIDGKIVKYKGYYHFE